MNIYILEFVNRCTGQEGVLLSGLTKREAIEAYKEHFGRWWAIELMYGPAEKFLDKPALAEF